MAVLIAFFAYVATMAVVRILTWREAKRVFGQSWLEAGMIQSWEIPTPRGEALTTITVVLIAVPLAGIVGAVVLPLLAGAWK